MRQATPLAHDTPREPATRISIARGGLTLIVSNSTATATAAAPRRATPALRLIAEHDAKTLSPDAERLERVRAAMRRVRELSAHHDAGTRRLGTVAQSLAESAAQLARALETLRVAPVA